MDSLLVRLRVIARRTAFSASRATLRICARAAIGGVTGRIPKRVIHRAIPVEEDLFSGRGAAHPQAGTLRVAALLSGLHVRDNPGGQRLRLRGIGFLDILPPLRVDLHKTYTG